MARLNEAPAPPMESLESLKRRFIRQNRDLARCNSTQSIKIRALETDLSHQLSENASLRTRILALENELVHARGADFKQSLAAFRSKMQLQFEGLVLELGELQGRARHKRSSAVAHVASPKRSPQQREWRNTSTLSEVLASQGGTMPTIVEGKYFPRRTLDKVDMQQLTDDADSPDMPPPKTFLDDETTQQVEPELGCMSAVEIRKRRRDSRVHERSDDEPDEQQQTQHPIKAGAKRKLSFAEMRHEEAAAAAANSPRKVLGEKVVNTDPVVSPRKTSTAAKDAVAKPGISKPAAKAPGVTSVRPASRLSSTTNATATATRPRATDSRATASRTSEPPKSLAASRSTDTSSRATPSAKSTPASGHSFDEPLSTSTSTASIKLEPQTPKINPNDILSPPSTQPSATAPPDTTRPGTPPPASIPATNTSADLNGPAIAAGGRGSLRRSRPAVSYAEPKINVKMRRPGNLGDAVVKKEARLSDVDGSTSMFSERGSVGPESVRASSASASAAPSASKVDAADANETPSVTNMQGEGASPLVDRKQRIRGLSTPSLPSMATSTSTSSSANGTSRTGMDIFEVEGTPPSSSSAPPSTTSRLSSGTTTSASLRSIRAPRASLESSSKTQPSRTSDTHGDARRQTVSSLAATLGEDDDGSGTNTSASVREVRLRAARSRSSVGAASDTSMGLGSAEGGAAARSTRSVSVSDLRAERRRSTVL